MLVGLIPYQRIGLILLLTQCTRRLYCLLKVEVKIEIAVTQSIEYSLAERNDAAILTDFLKQSLVRLRPLPTIPFVIMASRLQDEINL